MAKKRTMDNPNNKVPFFENYFNTSDINSPFVQQSIWPCKLISLGFFPSR